MRINGNIWEEKLLKSGFIDYIRKKNERMIRGMLSEDWYEGIDFKRVSRMPFSFQLKTKSWLSPSGLNAFTNFYYDPDKYKKLINDKTILYLWCVDNDFTVGGIQFSLTNHNFSWLEKNKNRYKVYNSEKTDNKPCYSIPFRDFALVVKPFLINEGLRLFHFFDERKFQERGVKTAMENSLGQEQLVNW